MAKEPRIDAAEFIDPLQGHLPAQGFINQEKPIGVGTNETLLNFCWIPICLG